MQDVERLDYSKPPPGYTVGLNEDVFWRWSTSAESGPLENFQPEALAAAWAHYKARHDPPGMWAIGDERTGWSTFGIYTPERFRTARTCRTMQCSPAEGRAAAWAWHDHRLALAAKLNGGTFCPECYSQDAYVEAIDDETSTQPWCTECDVEMGGLFDGRWPRCLAWSDEEVAAVERWLVDSTAEMPEVLCA